MDNEKREFEDINLDVSPVEEVSEEIIETELTEESGQADVGVELEVDESSLDEKTSCEVTDDVVEQSVEETSKEVIPTEEDIQELKSEKKRKTRKIISISAIVVGVLFVIGLIYSLCVINGVGSKTIVNTSLPAKYSADGEKLENKKYDIKFENPFISLFGGKNADVIKVNGYGIDSDEFDYFVKGSALNYQYELLYSNSDIDFSKFDWNEIDEETSLRKYEIAKGDAVESVSVILAIISEAEKRGIVLTEEDEKSIDEWANQIKESYGDGLGDALKQSGYDSLDQLIKIQKMQTVYQKAYEAFTKEPLSYVKHFDNYEKAISNDLVTVQHILIQFPEGVTKDSTDEEKAETLKEAEEVLKKAKAGEDFKKLISDFSTDPGQGEYGYTFANDGSMVQEFADASFALKVNEISDIVETSYGYHIIKRTERIPSFDEYVSLLEKNMKIRINKFLYSNIVVDANISEYMGGEVAQSDNAGAESNESNNVTE